MIAAVAADELKRGGTAVIRPALHDARWLTPQVRLTAVAGLTGRREVRKTVVVTAQPRLTEMAQSA
jgi:hypothetical protein